LEANKEWIKLVYDLVAIGNPVYDIIRTPHISTKGRILSGCSTNACLAAAKLGMKSVTIIGCIGRNFFNRFINDLEKYGVNSPKVKVSKETGGFKLVYDMSGNRTLEVLGVAGKITKKDVPDECLNARHILLGPILQEVDLDLVSFLRETTKSKIFLDPQGLIRKINPDKQIVYQSEKETVRKIVNMVDFVKPNEHESIAITGTNNPSVSAKTLVDWRSPVGIVTLAEKGSVVFDGEKIVRIPAYKTFAIDPTGAGDVYAGAFIYEYIKTEDVVSSCLFASAAASIMVEHSGPDFPMGEKEVRRRLMLLNQISSK